MNPPFFLRETATEAVKELLKASRLGTAGARYQQLLTDEIINELDEPLFLSLERNNKVLANVTFCRRDTHWYIRYFSFAEAYQKKENKQPKSKANGLFKKTLEHFFQEKLNTNLTAFYAYVDPRNTRSKQFCESLGFRSIGSLATQSFSRYSPQTCAGFEVSPLNGEIEALLAQQEMRLFYSAYRAPRSRYAIIRSAQGELVAFAAYQLAHWRIHQLPGKFGKLKTKLIPILPFLSRLFSPKNHRFLVPEAVYVKNDDPQVLSQLFEAILAEEKHKILLWWVDSRDPLYTNTQTKITWGPFDQFLGRPAVHLYAKSNSDEVMKTALENLFYVAPMDLI